MLPRPIHHVFIPGFFVGFTASFTEFNPWPDRHLHWKLKRLRLEASKLVGCCQLRGFRHRFFNPNFRRFKRKRQNHGSIEILSLIQLFGSWLWNHVSSKNCHCPNTVSCRCSWTTIAFILDPPAGSLAPVTNHQEVHLFWLVVKPPLWKNMSSSIGMMTFPIYGKISKMATKPPTSLVL